MALEDAVQRLFSTFADGWPGLGLLLQRILTAILFLRIGVAELNAGSLSSSMIPQLIGVLCGLFLLVGLFTPVVGTLIAMTQLWIAITGAGDPWTSISLMTLGASLAMIGPGAWSLDARVFGRKRMTT